MSTPQQFKNTGPLKAFVLGCDPTAFSKEDMDAYKKGMKKAEERKVKELNFVFDIGGDQRYFAGIKANLEAFNIKMENIYVQNLVTEYQHYLTSEKPKEWESETAKYRVPREAEFNDVDPTQKVPVFLTSYLLYKVLIKLKKGEKPKTAAELFEPGGGVVIPAEANYLGRPLAPLFRHTAYSSKNRKEYFERVRKELGFYVRDAIR